jgi:quercetin dioxygenase-like cupin family protein
MKICRLETSQSSLADMPGAEKVYKQIPISKADGSPNFSFRVFTIEPDGHTPFHEHAFEHINYVIEGSGVIKAQDGKEFEVKKGNFALVLPGEKHQYRNTSKSEPLVIICAVPKEYE